MKIKFISLLLQCRKSREIIDFSPQITYIHGQISAGKSSILRLIDFCLGGDVEKTPAISQELVNVGLTAQIGEHEVLFERDLSSANSVQVTWRDSHNHLSGVLAPITASKDAKPIWGESIINLSDLIFHLAGITPIKVRKSKRDEDSELVRLSFRDMMWYCYLDQDHLDSSFYRLEDTFRKLKSRDVIRFVTGYYTEKMSELEVELERVTEERLTKIEAAKQVRLFLDQFGFGSEPQILVEIEKLDKQLQELRQQQNVLKDSYHTSTHFADELRGKLRQLTNQLSTQEVTLVDLRDRITEQESLKAELLTAKFKLARAETASVLLAGVVFERCPSCGTGLENLHRSNPDLCQLCGNQLLISTSESALQMDVITQDLTSRITDLDESIARHTKALANQHKQIEYLKNNKLILDTQLTEMLSNYDSDYLIRSREVEKQIATFEERIRNLNQTVKMFAAVIELEKTAENLRITQQELRQQIDQEKYKLGEASERIASIEKAYKKALISVKVPGVFDEDTVTVNLRTWIPWIKPIDGDIYNFFNAGSGGKKTLLNVCYALAVHEVAAQYDLPLPTFLMIDTPMKNIGEDVNRNIFQAFYLYLYELAANGLSNTQLIIVDKEFFPPDPDLNLAMTNRFMSPENPLISYYRGA